MFRIKIKIHTMPYFGTLIIKVKTKNFKNSVWREVYEYLLMSFMYEGVHPI